SCRPPTTPAKGERLFPWKTPFLAPADHTDDGNHHDARRLLFVNHIHRCMGPVMPPDPKAARVRAEPGKVGVLERRQHLACRDAALRHPPDGVLVEGHFAPAEHVCGLWCERRPSGTPGSTDPTKG